MSRRTYSANAFNLVKIATWDRWTIVPTNPFVEKIVDMLKQDGTWNRMVEAVLEKHSKSFDEDVLSDGMPSDDTVTKILDDMKHLFNSTVTIFERY